MKKGHIKYFKALLLIVSGMTGNCINCAYGNPNSPGGLSYVHDIKPIMEEKCNSCHSGTTPAGNYATDTYEGLFGNGSDNVPNVVPLDKESLLMQKINPENKPDAAHSLSVEEARKIYGWIVGYDAKKE